MTDDLAAYRHRRDLAASGEPEGSASSSSGEHPIFVIQKHDARTLHYDVRLEVDGVLKSWAVPKGPSTDPSVRRLAQPTEDHPLDYARFEGVIPEGHYGAGTVLVWDTGTYRNLRAEKPDDGASMQQSLEEGKVEVWLDGRKLRGGYALIRMKDRDGWLLIKMNDDEADARRNPVRTEPDSVLTGRSLDEIRAQEGD
ncbi:MAG: DNA ligase [Bacteroidetes bacterium]|nr:DNA ligase [Rhodothermaceae bacterium RA]RMH68842.1 MAG: DNA ligase [Bacteroidota bacterium]